MKFYIQMGHGMQTICKDLCEAWQGATIILSPQNIYPTEKLSSFAALLRKVNGSVLFDPQLYPKFGVRIFQYQTQQGFEAYIDNIFVTTAYFARILLAVLMPLVSISSHS